MPFICKAGETLYLNDGGGGHLKLVATDPDENMHVVLISFTTAKPWKEQILTFTHVDNPKMFGVGIVTTVSYEHSILARAKDLLEGLKLHPRREGPPCSKEMLEQIVAGAKMSSRVPVPVFVALRKGHPHLFD